jgi:hypothetical protein
MYLVMSSWIPKEMTLPRPYTTADSPSISLYHSLLSLTPHEVKYQTVLEKHPVWAVKVLSVPHLTYWVGFISKLKATEGLGKSKDQQSQEQVVPIRKGSQSGTQNRNQTTDKTRFMMSVSKPQMLFMFPSIYNWVWPHLPSSWLLDT